MTSTAVLAIMGKENLAPWLFGSNPNHHYRAFLEQILPTLDVIKVDKMVCFHFTITAWSTDAMLFSFIGFKQNNKALQEKKTFTRGFTVYTKQCRDSVPQRTNISPTKEYLQYIYSLAT